MTKFRRAAKIDSNQNEVIKQLLQIPGMSVAKNHDDFLVGYEKCTFWVELKSELAVKKDGTLKKNAIKPSQKRIRDEWTGNYIVAHSFNQIIQSMSYFFDIMYHSHISENLRRYLR